MIGPIVASLGSRPIPPLLSSPLGQKSQYPVALTYSPQLFQVFGSGKLCLHPFYWKQQMYIYLYGQFLRSHIFNFYPPIFSRLLEFSWMLSMAFVSVTSLDEEEESAFELLSSFSEEWIDVWMMTESFVTMCSHLSYPWHPWRSSLELRFCPSKSFGSWRSSHLNSFPGHSTSPSEFWSFPTP